MPVDAVITPVGYANRILPGDPSGKSTAEFKPILGVTGRIVFRDVPGGSLITEHIEEKDKAAKGIDHHTLLFPTDHPLAGQPRYEWKDRGDGVLYGTLVPEASPKSAEPAKPVEAAVAAPATPVTPTASEPAPNASA